MLDSDQEPSYNLSKNLLLLPRILKSMKDMVDDSTPLLKLSSKIFSFTISSLTDSVNSPKSSQHKFHDYTYIIPIFAIIHEKITEKKYILNS